VTPTGVLGLELCNVNCSLTQGFYGNQRGKYQGTNGVLLVAGLLSLNDPQTGAPGLVVGIVTNGTYLLIGPDQGSCIARRLPAGGPSVPLTPGVHTFTGGETCTTDLPLDKKSLKFRNVLLGQTITLALNVRLDTALSSVALGSNFCTVAAVELPGGGLTPGDKSTCQSFHIPASVFAALDGLGLPKTVAGLLTLANRALSGLPTGTASLSDINSAVSAINEGFDECRFVVTCTVCD
jgi:hypothetical protein